VIDPQALEGPQSERRDDLQSGETVAKLAKPHTHQRPRDHGLERVEDPRDLTYLVTSYYEAMGNTYQVVQVEQLWSLEVVAEALVSRAGVAAVLLDLYLQTIV
jgi:hypothetical protein